MASFTVAPHQYPSAARLFHSLLDIAFALFYSLYFFPLFPAVCCAHVCVSVCGYKNISFNFLFLLALAASLSLSLSSWSASRCPLYRTSAPASPSSGPSSISLALTRFRVQRFILPSQRTTRFLIFFAVPVCASPFLLLFRCPLLRSAVSCTLGHPLKHTPLSKPTYVFSFIISPFKSTFSLAQWWELLRYEIRYEYNKTRTYVLGKIWKHLSFFLTTYFDNFENEVLLARHF